MKVVFILGSGHCGSTLLDLILDSHSNVTGVGELTSLHSSKDVTDEFWQQVFQEMSVYPSGIYRSKKDSLFNRQNFLYTQTRTSVNKEKYIIYHENLYETILKTGGTEIIVDSSKNVDKVQLLLQSKKIEPYIIHMSREWGAVFYSYYRKYPDKPFFSFFKRPMANMKVGLLGWREPSIPYYFLTYEDLVMDPEKKLIQICDFIGIPFQTDIINFRSYPHHTLGGNRMKNSNESEIVRDESWKSSIPSWLKYVFFIFNKVENIFY